MSEFVQESRPAWTGQLMGWLAMPSRSDTGLANYVSTYGPGYRIYFQQRGKTIILLLCGGTKRTQSKDIKTALRLARELSESND